MKIIELTYDQFDNFAKYHPLNNYCQSSKYALVMTDMGYNYDYIGYVDDANNIIAASLILTKRIVGKAYYGYAPKGFLANYANMNELKDFIYCLREYYKKKGFIFIKFNPEIIIGSTTKNSDFLMNYNGNVRIIDELKNLNVKRRIELKEFDLMQPKFNAYINLKDFYYFNLNRNYRKKIKKAFNSGLYLSIGDSKDINILYEFLKNKTEKSLKFYRNLYNIYSKDNSIDLILIKINFQTYLNHVKEMYDYEIEVNDKWNIIIQNDPRRKNLNGKMDSDRKLQEYKEKIIEATDGLKQHNEDYVAAALVVKQYNRISIVSSGFNSEYSKLNPNHFLYYSIMERYKNYFNYCDMNGLSGTWTEESEYYGLNEFKLNFNPIIFEFLGEFDLICNDKLFKKLIKTSFIEDEFSKNIY